MIYCDNRVVGEYIDAGSTPQFTSLRWKHEKCQRNLTYPFITTHHTNYQGK